MKEKKLKLLAKFQSKGPKVTQSKSPIKLCDKNEGYTLIPLSGENLVRYAKCSLVHPENLSKY